MFYNLIMSTLILDIRNHNEIDKKRFTDEKLHSNNETILYLPANMIKYNLVFLKREFMKYQTIKLICNSGNRSRLIKNKYFQDNSYIVVNKDQFKDISKDVVISKGLHMNLVRKVQLIAGSLILFFFLITLGVSDFIYSYLLLGLMMLYVSLSGNCFMSSFLTKNDF